MIVIGLTGGIASGKSTVSRLMAELGAVILDADKVGHEALTPGTEVYREVVAAFGNGILLADSKVDRKKLGEIVFNDPGALARLNAIMHPRMFRMMEQRLAEYRGQGVPAVVLEAAVLLEAGWAPLVDEVWVTQVTEETAIRRLRERNGLSEAQALARLRSQLTAAQRARQADIIIGTDCPLPETERQVRELWQGLQTKLAKESVGR
ncbi:MAG: dephospho-CoA kinase [Chloroflexi bacterium]|nr:dephospho-CoA kinase [Chloroflexota bacterium]